MRQKFHVVLSPPPALDPGDATSGRPATLTHSLPSRVGFRPVHFEVFCPSDNKECAKARAYFSQPTCSDCELWVWFLWRNWLYCKYYCVRRLYTVYSAAPIFRWRCSHFILTSTDSTYGLITAFVHCQPGVLVELKRALKYFVIVKSRLTSAPYTNRFFIVVLNSNVVLSYRIVSYIRIKRSWQYATLYTRTYN